MTSLKNTFLINRIVFKKFRLKSFLPFLICTKYDATSTNTFLYSFFFWNNILMHEVTIFSMILCGMMQTDLFGHSNIIKNIMRKHLIEKPKIICNIIQC